MMTRHDHNDAKDNHTLTTERPQLTAVIRSLSKPRFVIVCAAMVFIPPSATHSQAINPTIECDDSTVGQPGEFSGCDTSAHVIEIDTYECIQLDNGAYKWDFLDARHTSRYCRR